MNERLKKLRKTLDLTQRAFGERIGVKGNTIAQYEIGRNQPIDAIISLICREFSVNETWLRTGVGEMFLEDTNDELEILAEKYHLSTRARTIVKRFLNLKPEVQEGLIDYAIQVATDLAAESAPAEADPRSRSEKPVTEWTEEETNAEAEEYRRSLLEEKRRGGGGSASGGPSSSGTA